jgi:hypothetical protein
VTVGALDRNSLDGPGNRLMTLAAKYVRFFIRRWLLRRLLLDNRGLIIAPLFGWFTQKMKTVRIRGDHLI